MLLIKHTVTDAHWNLRKGQLAFVSEQRIRSHLFWNLLEEQGWFFSYGITGKLRVWSGSFLQIQSYKFQPFRLVFGMCYVRWLDQWSPGSLTFPELHLSHRLERWSQGVYVGGAGVWWGRVSLHRTPLGRVSLHVGWSKDNLWQQFLVFHHIRPRHWTQVLNRGPTSSSLPSHLKGTIFGFTI